MIDRLAQALQGAVSRVLSACSLVATCQSLWLLHLSCYISSASPARRVSVRRQARKIVRRFAGLPPMPHDRPFMDDLVSEIKAVHRVRRHLRPLFGRTRLHAVLFAGQAYYNHWYLSRALRSIGWTADLIDFDPNLSNMDFYHGSDYRFDRDASSFMVDVLSRFVDALYRYDIFHFANAEGLCFTSELPQELRRIGIVDGDVGLAKSLGIRIAYTNNGCRDGVRQTTFAAWGPDSPCRICKWRNVPTVCSDEKNRIWGEHRNSLVDVHFLLGGNRADFNDDMRAIEAPEIYCLDSQYWRPDLPVPVEFRLATPPLATVRLYHAVGNRSERTQSNGVNIKCTHIYVPLVESFRREGLPVELVSPPSMPNRDIRFVHVQADIHLDMLTFGWFGATAREAMMLGKPVVCFVRPEWLESVREQCPEYAAELPVVHATPETIAAVLRRLICDRDLRESIGARSRDFALKWHDASVGASFAAGIYRSLLFSLPLSRGPRKRVQTSHV